MITLDALERGTLLIVADYQARHHGQRMWAGRGGTSERELQALAERGLLDALRDENGYRWWYGLTPEGREAIA
jgi:DNA-binding PadR family transcriptional regulator